MKRIIACLTVLGLLLTLWPPRASAQVASGTIYEAELGQLIGTTASRSRAGYSGTGYVTGFDNNGDSVRVTVSAPTAGLYLLTIRYACDSYKANDLFISGVNQGSLSFPTSRAFTELPAVKVWLEAGASTVELRKSWGWFDVDYFKLEPAPPRPPLAVPSALANPNASPAARALMAYLTDIYGKQIISGQGEIQYAEWLASSVGKRPALLGLDFMDYSPSRVERGARSTSTETAIAWWQSGGIVAFQWHWNAPTGLIDQPGKEWWRGFYTDATTFDLAAAINNPASPEYALLLRDIDAIAVQLKRLQDAGVPVLWRPLHEAQGGWFWWGAKGPEPCLKLYRLMYDHTGSSTISGWTLAWSFANGQTISQLWNATYTQSGASVSAKNLSWNATIAPGGSVNFGFLASWNASNSAPTSFTLNGSACAVAP